MAQSYAQLRDQIAKLEREAESARKAEIADVIGRIKEAIAAYGLTAQDLFSGKRGAAKGVAKSEGKTSAKYGDGAGNVWGGRGPRPQWLRDALAAGKSLEDFAMGRSAAAPKAAKGSAKGKRPAKRAGKRAAGTQYSDGAGNQWGGRGPRPRWLREAIEGGKSLEDFKV